MFKGGEYRYKQEVCCGCEVRELCSMANDGNVSKECVLSQIYFEIKEAKLK